MILWSLCIVKVVKFKMYSFSKLEPKIESNKVIIVVCQNGRILFYSCGQTKTVMCNEILLSLHRYLLLRYQQVVPHKLSNFHDNPGNSKFMHKCTLHTANPFVNCGNFKSTHHCSTWLSQCDFASFTRKKGAVKVAFFRKCDSIFTSPNLKKNIPKNYPELEIQISSLG